MTDVLLYPATGDGDVILRDPTVADAGDNLVRVLAEAVVAGDDRVRARAMARARADALAFTEAPARVRGCVRRRAETVGMAEAGLFARALTRLRAGPVAIAETTISVLETLGDAVIRVVAEAAGVAETVARSRNLARMPGEMVGIATAIVRTGGVVRTASAAMIDRTRMAVGAARRLIVRTAGRFNVPPARRM
jgi:hypothetical protein